MNKTTLFVIFSALAGLGLVGYVVILVAAPEQSSAFVGTLISVLAIVSGSATTFWMLGKNQTTLEQVKTQTNGNLSAKEEEIARLRAELTRRDRLADPSRFDDETGETIVPD